jgi:chaperonin cofactor prefoldin
MKKTKKLNDEKHYIGALLESMDSKVDVLVDGHRVLDGKIEDLRGEVNERFNKVDHKFEMVFDELHLIRNELKEKVGRDEFVFLEKRVSVLEKSRIK